MIRRLAEKARRRLIAKFDTRDSRLMREYVRKKYGIEIGRYTYGYDVSSIAPGTKIGNFCSIAPGVRIGLMNHPISYVTTHPFLYYKNRGFLDGDRNIGQKHAVVIEDDVWLGVNAVILPGVTVHKGAVIGAGAVVTKDVPEYAVWGGVPAKLIKWRFDEETREKLIDIDWCHWDDGKIANMIECFYNAEDFIRSAEKEETR